MNAFLNIQNELGDIDINLANLNRHHKFDNEASDSRTNNSDSDESKQQQEHGIQSYDEERVRSDEKILFQGLKFDLNVSKTRPEL